MTTQLTTAKVWDVIKEEPFAVLGVVTARNECRTVGIIYEVDNQKLYIGTNKDANWKVLTPRLSKNGLLTVDEKGLERIMEVDE